MHLTVEKVATLLGIITLLGAGYAKFYSLDEAKTNLQGIAADHERRISAQERDNSSLNRFQDIQLSMQAMQFELKQLRQEVSEIKKRGR